MDYKKTLLAPIKIGKHTCANRFFAQPMECVDADMEGNPTDKTYARYESFYKGEFGFVDLEAITVTNESRARKTQLQIMPRNEKPLVAFIKRLKEVNPNVLIVFQLTHAGELSKPDFSRRVSVKQLPGYEGDLLTEEEVDNIMEQFVLASKICENVGADGIDLKFCHGYLGSQILRPYNDRDWKYGGSWQNRSRFAYDLMERIRREVSDDFIIGSKLSLWEGFPGGCGSAGPNSPLMDLTESIDLAKGLEERGASYFVQSLGHVHASLGFMEAAHAQPYITYLHLYFANILKQNVKPETVVIGSGFSPFGDAKKTKMKAVTPEESSLFAVGARCIEDGMMDMIGLGRQVYSDPLTPLKLREGREDEVNHCTLCMNCEELMIRQQPVGCVPYNKVYTQIFKETREKFGKLADLH